MALRIWFIRPIGKYFLRNFFYICGPKIGITLNVFSQCLALSFREKEESKPKCVVRKVWILTVEHTSRNSSKCL